jgi:hypothetical protein
MNTLNADVYASVSDDAALDLLLTKISINGKTFAKSSVWSRSFQVQMQIFHRKN